MLVTGLIQGQLPFWEDSILVIMLASIGVLAVVMSLLSLGLRSSKRADSIWCAGIGVSFLLLVLWGFLLFAFDVSSFAGWRNGILASLICIIMGTIINLIPIKILNLVQKYKTISKLSIWMLIVAWPITIGISLYLIFGSITGAFGS